MVFIDGSNFYYGLKQYIGQTRLNFDCFCRLLCGENRRLVYTHYYNVPVRQSDDPGQYARQQKFFAELRRIPHFALHLGRLVDRERAEKCPGCQQDYRVQYRVEKGVDVELAVNMLAYGFDDQYDIAIIASQDSDFTPAVDEVRRLRKRVENADFPERLPSFLSKKCDSVIHITKDFLQPCL